MTHPVLEYLKNHGELERGWYEVWCQAWEAAIEEKNGG